MAGCEACTIGIAELGKLDKTGPPINSASEPIVGHLRGTVAVLATYLFHNGTLET